MFREGEVKDRLWGVVAIDNAKVKGKTTNVGAQVDAGMIFKVFGNEKGCTS